MLKRGVYSLCICAICLFVISVPLFAEVQADPLDAAGLTVTESEKAEFLKLSTKYNPKTISVEKCRAILSSSPGTNAALEAQAHLLAHEIYTQQATDIQLSMQSLYRQYGSLSSMPRAVKIIASAYEEKKDYAAVIPLYTEAIKILKDKGEYEYRLKGSLVRAYIETGQNDKADVLITEVLAKCLADSKNAESLKLFFSLLDTDKTLPAAVRIYSEALKAWGVFDLQCRFRCRLVKGYVQLKEYDKAMALARIAVQRDIDDPNNVQSINEIARQMSNSGYKEEAARAYQAIIQKYPEHPETHEAYGGLILNLLDLGRKKEAAQRAEEYTAKYAGKPEYMSPDGEHAGFAPKAQWIVKRLQGRGQMDEALTLAEGLNAGQAGPTMESIKTLAVARIKAGQLDEAAKLTNTLIKDYPMNEAGAMAVVEVAAAFRESGQLDKAMGLYEYAMGIAKGTKAEARARAGRAQIWVTQGKDEDVKAEVDAIIADANSLPGADEAVFWIGEDYYNKAQKASGEGNAAAAKAACEKAIAILQTSLDLKSAAPQKCIAYYTTGLCYRELGDFEKAADAFYVAIEADPGFIYAGSTHWLIADCYEKLKRDGIVDAAEADPIIEREFQTLFDSYPDSRDVAYAAIRLGEINLARGKPVAACVYFNWFLDYVHAGSGQFADISQILARLKECGQ